MSAVNRSGERISIPLYSRCQTAGGARWRLFRCGGKMVLVHCAAKFEVVIMHVEKKRMENTDGCKLYSWTTSIYHATMGTVLAANKLLPRQRGRAAASAGQRGTPPPARARSQRRFKMQKWPLFLSFPVRPCERYWHRPERGKKGWKEDAQKAGKDGWRTLLDADKGFDKSLPRWQK